MLIRVPAKGEISDAELLRRYKILYPKPTKYATAQLEVLEKTLAENGPAAEHLRKQWQARMGDVSEFMKSLKQRFSVWYNRSHGRYGPLWADRLGLLGKGTMVKRDGSGGVVSAEAYALAQRQEGKLSVTERLRFPCGRMLRRID